MKKLAACFALVVIFASCNIPEKGNNESIPTSKLEVLTSLGNEDTVKEDKAEPTSNSISRMAENLKPLLIARGSEPGWYAEFFATHLRLLVDYGKDSLILENDFSDINKDKTYTAVIENKLNISISNTACTEEASGEKREKSISVKYKNKTYTGCATSEIK